MPSGSNKIDKRWQNEKKCPICGKEFIMSHSELWVYRIDEKSYCSWTCYRKAQKLHKAGKAKRGKKKQEDA